MLKLLAIDIENSMQASGSQLFANQIDLTYKQCLICVESDFSAQIHLDYLFASNVAFNT